MSEKPPYSTDDERPCDDGVVCALLGHFEERCPNCNDVLPPATCQFTCSLWRCMGCGATLDSRVVMPKSVHRQMTAPAPERDA